MANRVRMPPVAGMLVLRYNPPGMRNVMIRNTKDGYGLVAIILHWMLAILVIGQIGLGVTMLRVADRRLSFDLIQWHKSIGLLILVLFALRLIWRVLSTVPRPAATLKRWERLTSSVVHRLLYAIFLVLPLSGWALVSASVLGIPTLVFGLFLLPHLPLTVSEASENFWRSAHLVMVLAGAILICAHILAALRHRLVLGDKVLDRMLHPARAKE